MNFKNFNVDLNSIYTALVDSIDDYIYIGDLSTNLFFISSNMAEDFDFPGQFVEDLVGIWGRLVHEQDQPRYFQSIQDLMSGKTNIHNEEYQVRNRQGQYLWVHCRGQVERDPDTGIPVSFVGVVKNPENMGKIDHITGLYTHEKCQEHLAALSDNGDLRTGGFLILGLDNFTRINTLHDHRFGDNVLRNTAQHFQNILPPGSYLYRLDGDQFGILAPKSDRAQLLELYQKIQTATGVRQKIDNHYYEFTVSAGAVCFPEIGFSWENIEKCASVALKSAKDNGKNQCIFFSPEMLDYQIREQQILQLMSDSVRNNFEGFYLVFQPIVSATDLSILGAEALLRFNCDLYGELSPVEFIPLLEATHLILPVGSWVLSEASKVCKKWVTFIPKFTMNINVSYLQFLHHKDFGSFVISELKNLELEPRHITLELTESYFVTDKGKLRDILDTLRNVGIKIAMDDFGTGYSSLGRLTTFHVDIIKIDRLFVQSIFESRYKREFIASVVRLCHSADMSVCIEGIEFEDEMQLIRELHPDTFQGFYISKPMKEDIFLEYIQTQPDRLKLLAAADSKPLRLRGDKDLLMLMMDATPLCLNLWNQNFENIECNQEAVKLFGLRNENEYLEHFFELSPPFQPDGASSQEKSREMITLAFEEGKCVFNWMHCKLNGELIPTEITLVRIKYQNQYIVAGYTRDLRHQLLMEKLEETNKMRIQAMLDAMPLSCTLWDRDGNCIDCNQDAVKLYKVADKETLKNRISEFSPTYQPDGTLSSEKQRQKLEEAFQTGRCVMEWLCVNSEGERIPLEKTLVRIKYGDMDTVASYKRDLRELKQTLSLNNKLEQLVNLDLLTGCCSRIYFFNQCTEQFHQLTKDSQYALTLLDFDYFKEINDSYGHQAGDLALKSIIETIQSLLPPNALLGRYGGDEFILQFMGPDADKTVLNTLMGHIITETAETSLQYLDKTFHISISAGTAVWNPEISEFSSLLELADQALYQAKNNGRNQSCIK